MKLADLSPIQRKALRLFLDKGAMNMRELGLELWPNSPVAHISKQVGNYGSSSISGLRLVRPATGEGRKLLEQLESPILAQRYGRGNPLPDTRKAI